MNTTKYLSFFIFLLFLSSCGSKGEEQNSSSRSNIDEFRSYPIDLAAPKIKFTELIEAVEIVRLEETEESLLGNVYNIAFHNDLIVFPNVREKSLYFFNSKGDYIKTLNKHGDGPLEYSSLWSYWFKGDTLKIYDNERPRVISYDLDGNYLREIKVPHNAMHVYENERGYWLDMSHRFIGDTTNYELISYDHKMENPISFLPFNQPFGFPIVTTTNSMTPYKDALVYKQIFNDSIYLIRGDKIEPLMHTGFGDDFLWKDKELLRNPNMGMSEIRTANKVWMIWPRVGEELVYLGYSTSFQASYQVILNRTTGEHFQVDTRKDAEEKLGLTMDRWLGNNTILISISSTDLALLLNDLEESQYSFREGSSLAEIESSENPALMWVKFKTEF